MVKRKNRGRMKRNEAGQDTQLPEEEAAAKTIIKEHTRSARRTNEETFKGVPSRDEVIPLSDDQNSTPLNSWKGSRDTLKRTAIYKLERISRRDYVERISLLREEMVNL